jgi:hypothetical protein
MRYVKVNRHYAYQHLKRGRRNEKGERIELDTDQLEIVEPGSVVPMPDELAEKFVAQDMGIFCDGPEVLIRPGKDAPDVDRPGQDPRPARAEQMTGRPQRAGAV